MIVTACFVHFFFTCVFSSVLVCFFLIFTINPKVSNSFFLISVSMATKFKSNYFLKDNVRLQTIVLLVFNHGLFIRYLYRENSLILLELLIEKNVDGFETLNREGVNILFIDVVLYIHYCHYSSIALQLRIQDLCLRGVCTMIAVEAGKSLKC